MSADRQPQQPQPRQTNTVVLALVAMVLADIRRDRERRATLTVMDGGRKR